MSWLTSRSRFALVAAALTFATLVAGCGGTNKAQVSGRVQYKDGSPVTGGVRIIRFEPTESSTAEVRKAASSVIEPDGSFNLFTRQPGDGVFPGQYAVTFTVMTGATGGESLIQPTYNSAATTPYEVEVNGDLSDLVYELEPK